MDTEYSTEIIEYATKLEWVDGKPVVKGVPIISGSTEVRMKDLLIEAMNLPYDGEDARYAGLTKGEALVIDLVDKASLGDTTARKEVLDRALGKPVQNIKSLNVRGSLEDLLDNLSSPGTCSSSEKLEVIEVPEVTDEVSDL